MKISAKDAAATGDLLDRARALYRDLSLGLQERIAQLTTGSDSNADCRAHAEAVKVHHRVLHTVLDLEANLEKHHKQRNGGTSPELDLDAARAEVLARLSLWLARK